MIRTTNLTRRFGDLLAVDSLSLEVAPGETVTIEVMEGRRRKIDLPVGAIVGELGMLSPSNMRTQTLECVEAGLILSVSYTKVEELYVQNPEFGFYFLRLASARLFENIEKLEQRLAQQTALAPAIPAVPAAPASA